MTTYARAIVVIGLLAIARPCFAWGEVGHRVVARIAASLLTASARAKVATILEADNTRPAVADALSDAAEWPDAVARSKYPDSQERHFIDLGVKPNAVKDNAIWASATTAFAKIVRYVASVKAGTPDELEPASDLEFLAHLIGDVHQPLHSATNKDRGGNCLFMTFIETGAGPSVRTKFHGAWDHGILEDRLGRNERLIARQIVRDAGATDVQSRLATAATQVNAGVSSAVRAWIEEAHADAVTKLYAPLRPVVPPFETAPVASDCHDAAPIYAGKIWHLNATATGAAFKLMQEQLLSAGVRLAALLNAAAE